MRITRGHWLVLGALTGTAIAAVIVDFHFEDTYRSETLVRLKTPPMWASAGRTTSNDLAWLISNAAQEVLSRRNLEALIETNGLYADRLQSVTLVDVIEDLRKDDVRIGRSEDLRKDDVRIGDRSGEDGFKMSFTYPDPLLAQRATQALLASMVAAMERIQAANTITTIDFLQSRVVQAACDWDAAAGVRRTAGDGLCAQTSQQQAPQHEVFRQAITPSNPPLDPKEIEALSRKEKPVTSLPKEPVRVSVNLSPRQQFDISLARDHYRAAREKLAEAQGLQAMEKLKLGPRLEVFEPPSYPISPVRPTRLILFGGFAGGLLVGQLAHLLLAWRSAKRRASFLISR
jgi:hypothetical protein